ncbi:MAG: hypothetical protein WC310_03500 [Patescibacteria group bacterium]|jgi:hypothetical protein
MKKRLLDIPGSFPDLLKKAVAESSGMDDVRLNLEENSKLLCATIAFVFLFGCVAISVWGAVGLLASSASLTLFFPIQKIALFQKKKRFKKEGVNLKPGFSRDVKGYLDRRISEWKENLLGTKSDYQVLFNRGTKVYEELRSVYHEAARQRDNNPELRDQLQIRVEKLYEAIKKNDESLFMLQRFRRIAEALIQDLERKANGYYEKISPFDTMVRADALLEEAQSVRDESMTFLIKATGDLRRQIDDTTTELDFLSAGAFSEVAAHFVSRPETDILVDVDMIEMATNHLRREKVA